MALLILGILLVVAIIYFATQDAGKGALVKSRFMC